MISVVKLIPTSYNDLSNVNLQLENRSLDVLQEHRVSQASVTEIREERGESLRHRKRAVLDSVTISFQQHEQKISSSLVQLVA